MRRPLILWIASRAVIALTLLYAFSMPVYPSDKNTAARTRTTLTNAVYRPFLINNIFNYYGNNGSGSLAPFGKGIDASEGFEFPKGLLSFMVFQDGIVWGGRHKGRAVAKVGGSAYRQALQAGPLLTSGTAGTDPVPANAADPKYRLYRIRPDVRPDIPFATVEAMLQAEEVPLIGRYEPVSAQLLYERYIADWNEWPADQGAPFKDVNGNGVYDPAVDIPGQPDADQTLWYVANDMSDSLTQRLAGCPPIGIEMQRTIWGYRRSGVLGNTIFMSTVLINKSGAPVDSMYITQWSDPDIGYVGDDAAGCDTTLDLGYAYNGYARDATYGITVPAVGFALIQGPRVPGSPTDTALFLSSRRPGSRNLGMSSFAAFMSGWTQFADPAQGKDGDLQWYRLMKGTAAANGMPFIDMATNGTTMFMLSGDPVRSTNGSAGWVDASAGFVPGDRRMCMTTGPFTLAAGDTQQVVVACLASRGADRLASITALRSDVRSVRSSFRNSFHGRPAPTVSCTVRRDSMAADFVVRVDVHHEPVVAGSVILATAGGLSVASATLLDAGGYGDSVGGDGVWTASGSVIVLPVAYQADVVLTYADGRTVTWSNVLDHITTSHMTVTSFSVVSDNINSDGIVNPGENVRFAFSLRNNTRFTFSRLATTLGPDAGNGWQTIGTLAAHATFAQAYDPADPGSYFFFDVPVGYQDSTFRVALVTTDDSLNVWRDTLVFPVTRMPRASYRTPLAHLTGKATGAFTIAIVDPARVKPHVYVLRGGGIRAGLGGYTLKDSTTGSILLLDQAAPDSLGHTSPVVDGFKVLRGTTMTNPGMRSWSVPQGTLRFSPVGGYSGRGLEGFSNAAAPEAYDHALGTIGAGMNFTFVGIGSAITIAECHTVLLKLASVNDQALWDPRAAPADPNFSRGYRYLRSSTAPAAQESFAPWFINKAFGHPYQDYNYGVPFSAWDMDLDPPMRLAVGHLECNVVSGKVDGRYWPGDTTTDNSIVRELAFIFAFPYTDAPDPSLMENLWYNSATPLMWVMACTRRAAEPWPGNDQFMIAAHHFPSPLDSWVFNPSVVLGASAPDMPSSFALMQNYPNPFNPSTTIRFDLPAQSAVTITVYDILGRAVRHLVRDVQSAGSHAVQWYADDDAGIRVASGVYFYRYTAARSDRSGRYDQTMKMILLK